MGADGVGELGVGGAREEDQVADHVGGVVGVGSQGWCRWRNFEDLLGLEREGARAIACYRRFTRFSRAFRSGLVCLVARFAGQGAGRRMLGMLMYERRRAIRVMKFLLRGGESGGAAGHVEWGRRASSQFDLTIVSCETSRRDIISKGEIVLLGPHVVQSSSLRISLQHAAAPRQSWRIRGKMLRKSTSFFSVTQEWVSRHFCRTSSVSLSPPSTYTCEPTLIHP